MIKHFISKSRQPFKFSKIDMKNKRLDFNIEELCEIEDVTNIEEPLIEYKAAFNVLKSSLKNADTSMINIDKIISVYNSKQHSANKFKNVVKKYNDILRNSLKKININMMSMDVAINNMVEETINDN